MADSKITLEAAYAGRDVCCRCGCKDTYAGPGTRGFKMRLNRLAHLHDDKAIKVEVGENDVNFSLENDRALTIYFD